MSLNAKKIGFFIGACGGAAYGISMDIARRCGVAGTCVDEVEASLSTQHTAVMSHTTDIAEIFACDGPDDDSVSCQVAQAASAAAGMYHLVNMLTYYPAGMTMAIAGGVLGFAVGGAIDLCFEILLDDEDINDSRRWVTPD